MTDDRSKTTLPIAESYTLTIERSSTQGLWYVTATIHPGLLVVGHTLGEALSQVETALADLYSADSGAGG